MEEEGTLDLGALDLGALDLGALDLGVLDLGGLRQLPNWMRQGNQTGHLRNLC